MIRVWLAVGLIVIISLLGLAQRWIVDEKERLLSNRLVMLKELTASTAIRSKAHLIRNEMRTLDHLDTVEEAKRKLIRLFDQMRATLDINLLRKIVTQSSMVFMDVKIALKDSQKKALEDLLSLPLNGVLTQILSLSYEDNNMELKMRWSLPCQEPQQ